MNCSIYNINKRYLLALLLSLFVYNASAQENEFEKRLQEISTQNKTIICDFTQTKKIKNIKHTIVSTGKFYYDNSGKMTLNYSDPKGDRITIIDESYVIIANGKKLEGNGEGNPMIQQICGMLKACMSGDISDFGRGWSIEIAKNGEQFKATLLPLERRIKKYIKSMNMTFESKNMTLDTLLIEETSGGFNQYEFTNKELNQTIDDDRYSI